VRLLYTELSVRQRSLRRYLYSLPRDRCRSVFTDIGFAAALEDFGSGRGAEAQRTGETGFGRLDRRSDLQLDPSPPRKPMIAAQQ